MCRPLSLFSAVTQPYTTSVQDEYVIVGNAGVLGCRIPSFVADFVTVSSWQDEAGATFFPSSASHGTAPGDLDDLLTSVTR